MPATRVVLAKSCFVFLFGFVLLSCSYPWHGRDASTPTNISEAVNALDKLVGDEAKSRVRNLERSELYTEHFRVAGLVRNSWLFTEGAPLREYFERSGIDHPDEMSAVVVQAFWMRMHGQAIDDGKLIDDHVAEIEARGDPFNTPCPDDDETLLEVVFGRTIFDRQGQETSETIYSVCPSTGSAWVFASAAVGWRPATEEERKIISDRRSKNAP